MQCIGSLGLWEFSTIASVTGQAVIKIFKYWPLLILYWTGECSILVRGGGRTIFQYRLVSDPNMVLSSIIINLVWLDTIQKYYGKIREILSNSSIWSNDKLCLMQAGQGRVMTMKQWTCDNLTLCPPCLRSPSDQDLVMEQLRSGKGHHWSSQYF